MAGKNYRALSGYSRTRVGFSGSEESRLCDGKEPILRSLLLSGRACAYRRQATGCPRSFSKSIGYRPDDQVRILGGHGRTSALEIFIESLTRIKYSRFRNVPDRIAYRSETGITNFSAVCVEENPTTLISFNPAFRPAVNTSISRITCTPFG